ncbi:hypothetical protein ACQZ46_23615 [Agrobacterium salinitolerans]
MPQKGDRREEGGQKKVWHHELGWVNSETLGWDGHRNGSLSDDEIQAEFDMESARVRL